MTPHCRYLLVVFACCGSLLAATVSAAEFALPDERFVNGLLKRELFDLAKYHCELQREAANSPLDQTGWAVQHARVLAAESRAIGPPRQAELAAAADRLLARAADALGDSNLRVVLLAERGRLALQAAEAAQLFSLQQQGQPSPETIAALKAAEQHFTSAEAAVAFALQRIAAATAEDLDGTQLRAIGDRIQLARARGLRLAAESYPGGSNNRLDAAQRSVQLLEPLAAEGTVPVVMLAAELERSAALRALGEFATARQLLESRSDQPALAERARCHLAEGHPRQALQVFAQGMGQPSPEAQLVALEAWLAIRQSVGSTARDAAAEQAVKLAKRLAADHGRWWARAAELRIGRALSKTNGEGTVGEREMAAASLFHAGRPMEALSLLEAAARQALASGDAQRAFALRFRACAIRQQSASAADAIAAWLALAEEFPANERSRVAHRTAIELVIARLRAAEPTATADLAKEYGRLLLQHHERWPDDHSVSLWLARWSLSQQDWDSAIDVAANVASDESFFPAALDVWLVAVNGELTASRNEAAVGAVQQRRVQSLLQLIVTKGGQWPEKMDGHQQRVAETLLRVLLAPPHPRPADAVRLVTAAQQGSDADSPFAARLRWWQMLAIALANEQAGADVAALPKLDREAAARWVPRLHNHLQQLPDGAAGRVAVAKMLLRATEPPAVANFAAKGKALRVLGRNGEAIAALSRAHKATPRDGTLALALASALAASGSDEHRQQAEQLLRQLEAGTPRGTPLWMEARVVRVELLAVRGDMAAAKRLARVTKLLAGEQADAALVQRLKAVLEK